MKLLKPQPEFYYGETDAEYISKLNFKSKICSFTVSELFINQPRSPGLLPTTAPCVYQLDDVGYLNLVKVFETVGH